MAGEAFEQLYDAVLTGDVTTFQQLLQQDPNILHRVSYVYCPNTTPPLHLATLQGNLDIVKEVMSINPLLARQLDCQKSSPLHIEAAEGYFEIASLLLSADPKMCWRHDCHDMNPIHVAAMNGNLKILINLITAEPFPAREKVEGRQTVLHLCVKHGQRKALELLVQILGDRRGNCTCDPIGPVCKMKVLGLFYNWTVSYATTSAFPSHLVSAEDHEGDTILHLAVRCYKTEMIRYLVNNNIMERSKVNSKGKTALDILQEIPPDRTTSTIEEILSTWSSKAPSQSLNKFREIGMVIAVLIAAMAFQAVVSPPGGVWQEES